MPLFEVAIIELETKENIDDGMPIEKQVRGPFPVLATDTEAAKMEILSEIFPRLDPSRCSVLVRPFVTMHSHNLCDLVNQGD